MAFMKKAMMIVGGMVSLAVIAGSGYALYAYLTPKTSPAYAEPEPVAVVEPVKFPMQNQTFSVPHELVTVTLNLVSSGTKRDYPMGRFTNASGTPGTLVAYDEFATAPETGVQAVPITVSYTPGETLAYLAVLDRATEAVTHVLSLPIGRNVTFRTVVRTGDQVTVAYAVHGLTQAPGEVPNVETSAIFDIRSGTVVQAGRDPLTEVPDAVTQFTGQYLWQATKGDSGTVSPVKPNVYTLTFDANRINLGTDCNSASAAFVPPKLGTDSLVFTDLAVTEMFCEQTQESDYFAMIKAVKTFREVGENLIFTLDDGREMTFIPKTDTVPRADSVPGDTPVTSSE